MTHQPVIIIGLPGAGKTHIAKEVALLNKLKHYDTDDIIETIYLEKYKEKKKVHNIYLDLDELSFRTIERLALKRIPQEAQLISCGGGLPCFFDNLDQLKRKGLVIWLNTELSTITKRLTITGDQKPSISNKIQENIGSTSLQQLLDKRKYYYQKADYHFSEKKLVEFLNKQFES